MTDISDEDKKLFRDSMVDVELTRTDKRESVLSIPKDSQRILAINNHTPQASRLSYSQIRPENCPATFKKVGIQDKTFKKLRRGQIRFELETDLHRMTLLDAEINVLDLINHAYELNIICIKIIHGRGLHSKPGDLTLRDMVRYLLTQIDEVLAFSACPPGQGGEGAVLVLLRRNKCD